MAFFGGGGASVDLASPPAIGNTTPNTGAFTTLSANNGTITTSSPAFALAQTWNAAGTTFTALQVNITDTASASGSLLLNLRVGSNSAFRIFKSGVLYLGNPSFNGVIIPCDGGIGINKQNVSTTTAAVFLGVYASVNSIVTVLNSGRIGFSPSASDCQGGNALADVYFTRDAANTMALKNDTNAQTFRLYRTFTDASNYERLGFIATRTTRFAIAAENAGTGAARSLEISFYTSASDPVSTDITDGCFSVWKNSGTGTIKLWANDGGTMKSVALA